MSCRTIWISTRLLFRPASDGMSRASVASNVGLMPFTANWGMSYRNRGISGAAAAMAVK